jgi:putative acetyltransferase
MQIRVDDLSTPVVVALLREHLDDMARHSPPESIHALDVAGLQTPGTTFWTIWDGADLAGCGALRELDPHHGEVKSMRTAAAYLRRGVAATMLRHVVAQSRLRGYHRLSLETGSADAFAPARRLYEGFGFTACAPFGDYVPDRHSTFLTLELEPSRD